MVMAIGSTVILMRGVPGSGKSTWAQKFQDEHDGDSLIVSADDFFMREGKYVFEPARIGEAHATCFRDFHAAVVESDIHYGSVIVDNTNVGAYEVAPYWTLAASMSRDVRIEIVEMVVPLEVCFARNGHNVPEEVILSMYRKLHSETLPHWWKHRVVAG